MSEATLRESIIREFYLDDERVGDETVVQITRGSLRRLTAAAQAATPAVQPEAQVIEQPPMKRLPCGCLANNLSRCPVHDAP